MRIIKSDSKTAIEIFCEDIKIFKISFACNRINELEYYPIKIEFLKVGNSTYEELLTNELEKVQKRYSELRTQCPKCKPNRNENDILLTEQNELSNRIIKMQQKLQNIIKLGAEGIEIIKNFYEEYIKYFSIDLSQKYTWYRVCEVDL